MGGSSKEQERRKETCNLAAFAFLHETCLSLDEFPHVGSGFERELMGWYTRDEVARRLKQPPDEAGVISKEQHVA